MKASLGLLALLGLASNVVADPTWPSSIDELEEIMYQLNSFRTRKFAQTVSPCSNQASGPGRMNAAEWLRAAFHDSATFNTGQNTGGLDASIQYELTNGDNPGPGFGTTLAFMSPYVTKRSSMSDLLALGVYASVRSCGGPIVPIRGGRKDVKVANTPGVPQPQNSQYTFINQFARMGYTTEEMIELTACGHSIGGVHRTEFPQIVPANAQNGVLFFDTTEAAFDNKVVTEYNAGTTKNPLVVGTSIAAGRNSDFKVFNADANVTAKALADAQYFNTRCQAVLQKMTERVPAAIPLTDPIAPYMVKPVELQLTLKPGGQSLDFTGYIRVKTTGLASGAISGATLTYKNRSGGSSCGSGGCSIPLSLQGISQGFDDTFSWFPIEAIIPASTGISSFTVTLTQSGSPKVYDNNGNGYPIQDAIMVQFPQSSLLGTSGALTLTAAVRNDRVAQGASAAVSYKVTASGTAVPQLQDATFTLTKGDCVGAYTLFSGQYTIPGGFAYQSRIDVINGDATDGFKDAPTFGGSTQPFQNPGTCGGGSQPSSSVMSSTSSTSQAGASSTTSTTITKAGSTTSTTSSTNPSTTAGSRPPIGDYQFQSCWTDDPAGRTLNGPWTSANDMTLEKCQTFCHGHEYFGTEYGQECWCGDSLKTGSKAAPVSDCNMKCAGDATSFCGAGNRLDLYKADKTFTTSAAPTPTHVDSVGDYAFVGCWNEKSGRTLNQGTPLRDPEMTNEMCAEHCSSYRYFGTEFSTECYCGSHVAKDTLSAPLEDCHMTCGGDSLTYCGGPSRLELFMNPDVAGGDPQQPAAAGDFVSLGCYQEPSGARALSGKTTSADNMTNEVCADFCSDYEYFGTEYGSECYCGNSLHDGADSVADSDCSMLCSGGVTEFCGAGYRLSMYKKQAQDVLAVTSDS